MTFRPDPKPEKVIKKKKQYQWKKKPSGEKEIFLEIWEERPHHSQISGEPIHEATASNFMHVLPKAQNKYPLFKLNKQNIVLATDEEHFLWDNMRYKIINDPKWQWVFQLETSLKKQYKEL